MSALGQKQTYAVHKAMSALPLIATAKADFRKGHVCFTPESAVQIGMSALGQKRTSITYLIMISVLKKRPPGGGLPKFGQALCSGGCCFGAGLQKGQEIGINDICLRGYHAVREALVGF
jgi:hypothetical protein